MPLKPTDKRLLYKQLKFSKNDNLPSYSNLDIKIIKYQNILLEASETRKMENIFVLVGLFPSLRHILITIDWIGLVYKEDYNHIWSLETFDYEDCIYS